MCKAEKQSAEWHRHTLPPDPIVVLVQTDIYQENKNNKLSEQVVQKKPAKLFGFSSD